MHQRVDVRVIKLHAGAAFEATRQDHRAITNSNQTTDSMTHSLKHASHLTVTPFRDSDTVPTIGTFTTALLDRTELCWTVIKLDSLKQALLFFLVQGA
jgi:hypothetical protein